MNRLCVLIIPMALFAVCNSAIGDNHHEAFTKGDLSYKVWQVDWSNSEHFEKNDIFTLTLRDDGKVKLKAGPKMKNRDWRDYDFESLVKGQTPYLCGKVSLKHKDTEHPGHPWQDHRVVISQENSGDTENILIQSDVWTDGTNCNNVTLPSHGGLAHAHVFR